MTNQPPNECLPLFSIPTCIVSPVPSNMSSSSSSAKSSSNRKLKSKLDRILSPSEQYPFHSVLRDASFFAGIIPHDSTLQAKWFVRYKYFQIVFMFVFCLRRLVECLLPKGSVVYMYIGDFKMWWGEPYVANQVVWGMAAILVPCYQFINLRTLCRKDVRWAMPFRFIEGIATARQINLEDEYQMNQLYLKMRMDYYHCFAMHYSVLGTYTIAVFVSYFILVYETYTQIFTLGLFWTIFEAYWSRKITLNMGLYPACLEIITFYLSLRYKKAEAKLGSIHIRPCERKVALLSSLVRIDKCLSELNSINTDLQQYDHYWRKYMISVLVSYLPQILFEIFSCLYVPMQTSVFVFAVTLSINMVTLVSQVCIFSAVIIHKAYSMKRPLNHVYNQLSLYLRENDTFGVEHNSMARKQLMKLSFFLEQYNHKQMGFHMLDYHLMDWNFYYNTLINCTVYFFLIVNALH